MWGEVARDSCHCSGYGSFRFSTLQTAKQLSLRAESIYSRIVSSLGEVSDSTGDNRDTASHLACTPTSSLAASAWERAGLNSIQEEAELTQADWRIRVPPPSTLQFFLFFASSFRPSPARLSFCCAAAKGKRRWRTQLLCPTSFCSSLSQKQFRAACSASDIGRRVFRFVLFPPPRSSIEMAQETNQTPGPMLCSTGCGFYGNPRTNGMCSVCYKEHLQRQQNSGRISPMGAASGSNSPTSDSASLQRAENSLNSCEGTASSTSEKTRNVPVAALPVMQRMTEMSISREETVSLKTEAKPVVTQPSPSVSQPSTLQSEEKATELPKPKKNRCFMCRKKVGLTGFDCRCGNLFCGLHRYSDKHNCPYDYKAEAAAKIRKENPVVVAEKIQRI